jgi:hypothetical protein
MDQAAYEKILGWLTYVYVNGLIEVSCPKDLKASLACSLSH